jgi:signal transduction histidine kinase
LALWIFNMTQFCLQVAGWQGKPSATWFGRWMAFATVCGPLMAYWALGLGQAMALTAWYLAVGVSCLIFGALFLWRAYRGATWAHRAVALALLVNVFTGLRDVYVYRINPSYGEDTYLRYASVLFGLSLAYIVITRFRMATAEARELQATLNKRVQAKEAELAQSYQQLEVLAREHERSTERARILRDMHDGVGSHISAAIRQLESGRATQADVLVTLRESLDHLKLSIDAMTLPPGDINALLANLRYRMGPRFTAIDVTLAWVVEPVPVLARLDADAMRQLQFLIFEAMSNVLQHAGARVLSIQAMATGPKEAPEVLVRVMDDGVGFNVTAAHGKGLSSMRQRAEAVGAWLDISSQPGRTCVDIRLG